MDIFGFCLVFFCRQSIKHKTIVKTTINIRIDEPINTANICLRGDSEEEYWKRGEDIDDEGIVYA
jgi:hypothetical protein